MDDRECFVCKTPAKGTGPSPEGGPSIDCPRCGRFWFDSEAWQAAQIYFMRTPEPDAFRTRMVVSHVIRREQPKDPYAHIPPITRANWEDILKRRLPMPQQQTNALLLWIGDEIDGNIAGRVWLATLPLSAFIGARDNGETLDAILNDLTKRDLLTSKVEKKEDGVFQPHVGLTLNGSNEYYRLKGTSDAGTLPETEGGRGRTLYNYLMSAGGWEPRRGTISASRFYADRDAPQFALINGEAPQALLDLPALLMPEVDGTTVGQTARIATITKATVVGRGELRIDYIDDPLIPRIPVSKIIELAADLDISTEGFALTHTHWTVRKADLFRVLLQHEATKNPQPSLFKLDLENRNASLIGVMMPFDAAFNPVYEAIKAAATAAGYQCQRADDIWLHHQVMQTIVSLICRSDIVIVDCTNKNPNVFYEAGIAHTLGRDVILLAQRIDDVPFDLRHLAILTYFPNQQGLDDLTIKLKARIEAVAQARTQA